MNDAIEFVYTSKEVSTSVGIATSTLRTWCLKLEAAGYTFKRTDDGKRMFFERDITALRNMKELLDKKHSAEYAVEQVTNRFNTKTHSVTEDDSEEVAISAVTPTVEPRHLRASDLINEIRQVLQEEVRQEIASAMEEQNKKIEEHINRRDQQITEVLREIQAERKKKWWQKLF